jgi:NADH-quinone oxidoreductase subunit J
MSAAFVVLSVLITLAALGMLFARKAVHAALLLAVVMIGLAMLYAQLDAPFLFAVQIVVYTGAILMLFLFVIMLVGVDVDDDVRETIAGQRLLAWLGGIALGVVLVTMVVQASLGTMRGLGSAQPRGNVAALADLMFSRYVVAFEATSALLITAVIGAMVLAHQERMAPRTSQHDLARRRLRDFADHGLPLGPLPPPGTYATRNAVDTPALLPDGSRVSIRPSVYSTSDRADVVGRVASAGERIETPEES